MSHTKEPWRIGRFTGPSCYEKVRETCGSMDVVADTETGPYVLAGCNHNFPDDAKANARRIVACVNSCAGISTKNLEDNIPIRELARRYNAIIKQRDDLMAALEHFATWGRGQHRAQSKGCHATFDMMMLRDEIDFAESAITRAKGESS